MADSDIILYLYPNDGPGGTKASAAISHPKNQSRFVPSRRDRTSVDRQERESTEQPEEDRDLEVGPFLEVRFSHGARSRLGVVVGCADNVDLTLPRRPGISRYHLSFTFDDQNRLIARDLGSLCGTRVVYDGEEGQRKSNFDWLLQGPGILNNKPPVLNITSDVQFKVIVPHRDTTSQDYIDNVARFRQGTADPENLFASLVLQSRSGTQLPSGAHTPSSSSGAILYKKTLGEGAFGVVTYAWNVTTGEEYALKEPKERLARSGQVKTDIWKKEARIMGSVSHNHIVTFLGATYSPFPQLRFEYVPGGSLEKYNGLSTFENTQVLCQLLSALRYLHALEPPIAHRDIKPANILVLYRHSGGIHVKFADFGLAKAADYLRTFCGTLLWAAPEIYNKVPNPLATARDKYSVAVDIYSCGVVVAFLECRLPKYKQSYRSSGTDWVHAVIRHVRQHAEKGNDLLSFLLKTMLVIDPQERQDAPCCHDGALQLLRRFSNSHANGSTSSDAAESSEDDEDIDADKSTSSIQNDESSSRHQQEVDEGSTVRPIRRLASPNPTLISQLGYGGSSLIDSILNPTESQTPHGSEAATSDTQPRQDLNNSAVIQPQGTLLGSELWVLEPESHEAASVEHGDPQADDISFLVRNHLGRAVQDEAQTDATHRLTRKRSCPGNGTSLLLVEQPLPDPASRVEAAQGDQSIDGGIDIPTSLSSPANGAKRPRI